MRSRLTVLQVIPRLDTGGAEQTALDVAAGLVARGDRALVASEGGRLEPALQGAGAESVRLPVATKRPLTILANARRLAALIARERVDVVHARSRAPAWSALIAARRAKVPFVTTFHGIYGEKGPLKRLYNSVMARGDIVIANSRYTAELIRRRYGTGEDRLAVIPRGLDLQRFSPAAVDEDRRHRLWSAWGLDGSERVVLHIARLTGWKGQMDLIAAAADEALAGLEGLVFVLAGSDQGRTGYRRSLEKAIGRYGLRGRVRLTGHCDDVPAALCLAELAVVASSEAEAFGRAAVEAQAMGVPVVATALGAAPETVLAPPRVAEEDRTGWLVPPSAPESLAAAIGAALRLPQGERKAIGERGRAHACRFSTRAMVAATLACYDRLDIQRAGS